MITVAIAGGTSPGLGRSIVRATKQYPEQLRCVVLSRKTTTPPKWLEEMGIELRKVDYSSEESLYQALQGVHTIISVMLATDGTWVSSQVNLLNAGLRAGISRFTPAEFGLGPAAAQSVEILHPTIDVLEACRETKRKNPDFEYACFHLGLFMNYLGYGAPDEEAATHGMRDDWVCVWDVKNMKAAIPLTKEGEVPRISMMEIGDVGRFVAAACLLPQGSWKEDFGMVGETIRLDEVVKIIEKVNGGKMEVTYRPYRQILQEAKDEKVFYPNKMWLQIEEIQARNEVNLGIVRPVLNDLCPSIQPMSVEQYMKRFWAPEA